MDDHGPLRLQDIPRGKSEPGLWIARVQDDSWLCLRGVYSDAQDLLRAAWAFLTAASTEGLIVSVSSGVKCTH